MINMTFKKYLQMEADRMGYDLKRYSRAIEVDCTLTEKKRIHEAMSLPQVIQLAGKFVQIEQRDRQMSVTLKYGNYHEYYGY